MADDNKQQEGAASVSTLRVYKNTKRRLGSLAKLLDKTESELGSEFLDQGIIRSCEENGLSIPQLKEEVGA